MAANPGPPDPAGAIFGWLLALAAALACAGFVSLLPSVAEGTAHAFAISWAEQLGVSFAFRLDGLSMVFALLISGFGAVIALYAGSYLKGHRHLGRFFLYLGLFMLGMLGLVLSDDLILMFVFWEMTTVASFLLIGFEHDKPGARRSAWQSLLITGAGGLALLAGLVLLGIAAGTTRISEILVTEGLTEHALYPAILTLILLGAFTKSAQIPFHIWLPNAMAAPTPVSAYLHSATMVKAGVYLLARLHPALAGTEAWMWSLSLAGGVTMVMAAVLALRQSDLKLALAYTSVMALGSLVMFLGAEATIAIKAAITFLIVHALYKAALFLFIGSVDHATGTREIARLGGLWRTMPMTALAGALAAGSMAGFPPFLGFIGKELKYEGALAIAEEPVVLAAAAVLANALMVTLALSILFRVIFGKTKPVGEAGPPRKPHESPFLLWAGPLALASLGLVFGVAPNLVGATLVEPALIAVTGAPQEVKLKIWHGVNIPLMMSFATVAIGLVGYVFHGTLMRWLQRVPEVADRSWDAILAAIASSFSRISRTVQPGSLRTYLAVSFGVLAALPLLTLTIVGGTGVPQSLSAVEPVAAAAALFAIAGAILAALAERRMAALGGLGAVGTGVAMLFVFYGAPDVAITQLMVDVMLIVLVASVMARLPELRPIRTGRALNAGIAIALGLAIGLLTYSVGQFPMESAVSAEMAAASVPEAKGRNIVNVILVDFRALDTFGEIVVVAAAALGALALIRMKPRSRFERARP